MKGLKAAMLGLVLGCGSQMDRAEDDQPLGHPMIGGIPFVTKAPAAPEPEKADEGLSEALQVVWGERDRLAKELGATSVGVTFNDETGYLSAVNCAVAEDEVTAYHEAAGRAKVDVNRDSGLADGEELSFRNKGAGVVLKNGALFCVRSTATAVRKAVDLKNRFFRNFP